MKARYPAFLSVNPTFLGLGLIDLIFVGLGLIFCLTFRLNSLYGTLGTVLFIGLNKFISKYIDIKGFLNSGYKKELNWMDSVSFWEKR